MTTITNDDGGTVTRINVMHLITYDVAEIVQQLREDNRVGDDDDLEITLDDVLERISTMAEDDFGYRAGLIYQDQDGNNY
jgi:hypothetical protein